MEKCKDFLPDYLRFIKGLVDSPDLPLNISRELLQQSREVKKIGKALEKNILKQLTKILSNNREQYEEFWNEYGKSLKIGVYNNAYDQKVKDDLKDLLMFTTSTQEKLKIYTASGKDKETISQMPQMELLRERGIEVLYLLDPIDEFAITALSKYAEKDFQSVSREDFELDDEESKKTKTEVEELAKSHEDLLKDVKEVLGAEVSDLKSGAVCLATGAAGPSLNMEKTFAAMNNPFFKAQRILEINPNHALFKKLSGLHALGKNTDDFKNFCQLLYTQALMIEGIMPDNPVEVANKIADLMAK